MSFKKRKRLQKFSPPSHIKFKFHPFRIPTIISIMLKRIRQIPRIGGGFSFRSNDKILPQNSKFYDFIKLLAFCGQNSAISGFNGEDGWEDMVWRGGQALLGQDQEKSNCYYGDGN